MIRKIAVKRLTASDLTFFEWHFRNKPAGNQKAINLNADIFIRELYPSLPLTSQGRSGRIPIDLSIYGPGLKRKYNLQRKIIKATSAYKNWRLDGEFIFNPADDPERFNLLGPGDIVAFHFTGDVYPFAMTAVFLSKGITEDSVTHSVLEHRLGNNSMIALGLSEFSRIVEGTTLPEEHPLNVLLLESALEDASLGGLQGTQTLLSGTIRRTLSRGELRQARENADAIGQLGGEYVNGYLSRLKSKRK